jgi:hypothetical protein
MNYHQISNYATKLNNTLILSGKMEEYVYNDGANYKIGYPTIGYGYALIDLSGKVMAWEEDFRSAGINFSEWGSILNGFLNNINDDIKRARNLFAGANSERATIILQSQEYKDIKAEYDSKFTTFNAQAQAIKLKITPSQAKILLPITVGVKEKELYDLLVKGHIITEAEWNSMSDSNEKMALISLIFNGGSGLFGNHIKGALSSGNRFKVWWEIKYHSNAESNGTNSNGLQNRRNAGIDVWVV